MFFRKFPRIPADIVEPLRVLVVEYRLTILEFFNGCTVTFGPIIGKVVKSHCVRMASVKFGFETFR